MRPGYGGGESEDGGGEAENGGGESEDGAVERWDTLEFLDWEAEMDNVRYKSDNKHECRLVVFDEKLVPVVRFWRQLPGEILFISM